MGQLPEGAVMPGRDRRGCRGASPPRRSSKPRLTSRRPRCRSTTRATSSRRCSARFPAIAGPHKEDICYATTNRQEAVKAVAPTRRGAARGRLAEFVQLAAPARGRRARGLRASPPRAARRRYRLERVSATCRALGITAGASAPEVLVEEIIDAFAERYDITSRPSRPRTRACSSRCRASCAIIRGTVGAVCRAKAR